MSPSKTALKSFAGSPTEAVGTSEAAAATDDVVKGVCGATSEESDGEHVQCEMCHVWQHYECFFSTTRHPSLTCIKCLLDKVSLEVQPKSLLLYAQSLFALDTTSYFAALPSPFFTAAPVIWSHSHHLPSVNTAAVVGGDRETHQPQLPLCYGMLMTIVIFISFLIGDALHVHTHMYVTMERVIPTLISQIKITRTVKSTLHSYLVH